MPVVLIIGAVIVAYLLGSIPMGVLAGKIVKGVEVRSIGSGRTGATNVYRAAGPLGLALTSLGDILKGILAVWVARVAALYALSLGASAWLLPWAEALSGIAAVAGHNWSVFLNFRGGAGTATTVGVLAAFNVYLAMAVAVAGLLAIILSRMASIGSILLALLMCPALIIAAALFGSPWAYVSFGVVTAGLTIYALTPNIRRLLAGQERRFKTNG